MFLIFSTVLWGGQAELTFQLLFRDSLGHVWTAHGTRYLERDATSLSFAFKKNIYIGRGKTPKSCLSHDPAGGPRIDMELLRCRGVVRHLGSDIEAKDDGKPVAQPSDTGTETEDKKRKTFDARESAPASSSTPSPSSAQRGDK